jgi:cytochrome c-type biogenesis protein CcmH/NrfF
VLLIAWGIFAAPPGVEAETESWGYSLAHELMSPYCPGRSLAACTSDEAAELRQWILLQEAAGASREEIIAVLEQRFGDVIRSSPEPEGWGLVAWLLPGSALLLGGLAVAVTLRRMAARGPALDTPAAPSPAAAPDDELARRVDREIASSGR